jgi:replicative DNA helicase
MAKNTPSAANIVTYASIVKERAILRELASAGTDIATAAFETEGRTIEQLIDNAQSLVFKIGEQDMPNHGGFIGIKEVLARQVDLVDKLFHADCEITGLSTGFTDIDKLTMGLQPSDLVIIAGRPSHGKTSFAMNIGESAALNGKHVAVFSMEMPEQQLGMRLSSSVGKIPLGRIRSGKLENEDWSKYTAAIARMANAKLNIDDSPALTPSQIRTRCRRLIRQQGNIDLIIIDYVQLMQGNRVNDTRAGELDEISRGLKAIAKEFQVPVIALAQLNRNIEQRPDKRPKMSDLRDSGGLEANADMIIFIYRDEVYDEDSPDKGTAEIIIGKQRNGPIGTVRLAFRGEFTRFENFAREYDYAEAD